ncbi:MAG: hypothetical protein BWK77_07275 [Verrucomicrobia bacterium A1]|nr:MAG: hypothetical protein BWK77_07275 [Verrucomicrobia bacterium A1]
MDTVDPHLVFLRPLAASGIPYMVTGSVACTVYGEPRMTLDVDLVVVLNASTLDVFRGLFPEAEFYVPPADVLAIEAGRERRGHFNVIHGASGSKADIYLAGGDPLHRWALDRRRAVEMGGIQVWLAPPEYVILRKLEYFREGGSEKHLRDIAGVLRVSGDAVDRAALSDWIRRMDLNGVWKNVENGI